MCDWGYVPADQIDDRWTLKLKGSGKKRVLKRSPYSLKKLSFNIETSMVD